MSEIPEFDGIVPRKSNDYITQQHIMRYVFASKFAAGKTVLDIVCDQAMVRVILLRAELKKRLE